MKLSSSMSKPIPPASDELMIVFRSIEGFTPPEPELAEAVDSF